MKWCLVCEMKKTLCELRYDRCDSFWKSFNWFARLTEAPMLFIMITRCDASTHSFRALVLFVCGLCWTQKRRGAWAHAPSSSWCCVGSQCHRLICLLSFAATTKRVSFPSGFYFSAPWRKAEEIWNYKYLSYLWQDVCLQFLIYLFGCAAYDGLSTVRDNSCVFTTTEIAKKLKLAIKKNKWWKRIHTALIAKVVMEICHQTKSGDQYTDQWRIRRSFFFNLTCLNKSSYI